MPLLARSPKSRVILGLMTFGPDPETGARVTSIDEYNTFLDHFQAAGYNEIDTARSYVGGKQEAFTKEAHCMSSHPSDYLIRPPTPTLLTAVCRRILSCRRCPHRHGKIILLSLSTSGTGFC